MNEIYRLCRKNNNKVVDCNSHLLLSNIYWFIENNPCCGFMTGWHSDGALVRHVVIRVR